jgi:uncharacterized membrane protein
MKRILPFLVVFLSLAVSGCAGSDTPKVQEQRQLATGKMAPGDAITVVGLSGISEGAILCIDDALRKLMPGAKVIPPAEFREIMFPWFEPNMVPRDTAQLSRLLRRISVKRRIDTLGVRYVVTIGGGTVDDTRLSAGPGGGGLGIEETTRLVAKILDTKQARLADEIKADVKGGGGVGFIGPIPFVVIPGTEKEACGAVAERIAVFVKAKP